MIVAIKKVNRLGRHILKDNGIQRLVPAKQPSGNEKNHNIESEDDVKAVHAPLLGQKDGNEVRSSTCRIDRKTHADRGTVQNAAKDTDEKNVLCDLVIGNQIDKK